MRKNAVFITVITLTIIGLLVLTSALNIIAFKKNYTQSVSDNNAIVASGIVKKIEYALRYGKTLENYYGVDDLFSQLRTLAPYVKDTYIADINGVVLYDGGTEVTLEPDELADNLHNAGAFFSWTAGNEHHILIPIRDKTGSAIAGFGFSYDNLTLTSNMLKYTNSMIFRTSIAVLIGVGLFVVLFFAVKHRYEYKKLLLIVIPVVIISDVFLGVASYLVYHSGYTALTEQTANMLRTKIKSDINTVTSNGILYEELYEIDVYFDDIVDSIDSIDRIWLSETAVTETAAGGVQSFILAPDISEKAMRLNIQISESFIKDKMNSIIVDICVSGITTLMIAAEVIIFIIAVLTGLKGMLRLKRRTYMKNNDETVHPLGIVRGLVFFFAMFQYMSLAFVPIVMAHIYEPIFGLPLEIMMTIPITAQILMSIFFAWICGKISAKRGWRPVALVGISIMVAGTLVAACAEEPVLFIIAQLILGAGLGCAKTAFDIFSVIVPSSGQLEEYSASTNAGLIVGMSCSAAIGAVIADVLGFSGAFLCMGGFGLFVILLIVVFADNIRQPAVSDVKDAGEKREKSRRIDYAYAVYIVFLILPYFFISMYVDYFFPVFANSKGMSTSGIGHIFLIYGISTSYVGSLLCNKLAHRVSAFVFAAFLLALLGVSLSLFPLIGNLAYAITVMLLIAVADGIMPSLQNRHVYSLDITKRLGLSRVIGIEGAFGSAIRGVAPVVFGFVMLSSAGLLIAGALVVLMAAVFFIANKKLKAPERNDC